MTGVMTFASALFDESTVAGFVDQFVRVLETISAKPNVVVGDIVVLGEADRALVLESGCGEVRAGVSGTLVDLFGRAGGSWCGSCCVGVWWCRAVVW